MNSNHRHVIHELAEFFGCKTHAVDKEPSRSVVVKAPKDKCYLPTMSIMDMLNAKDKRKVAAAIRSEQNSNAISSIREKESIEKVSPTSPDTSPTEMKPPKKYVDYFDFTGDE